MDPDTVKVYASQAEALASGYRCLPSRVVHPLSMAVPQGANVLEVGCGSGRDLNALLEAGYEVSGVDASEAMLNEAARCFPKLNGRLRTIALPSLDGLEDGVHDAVVVWAVLQHVPREALFESMFNLRRVLKPGGHLLMSTPLNGPDVDPKTHRDAQGRLFNQVPPEQFRFLVEKLGFRLVQRWDEPDSANRANRSWATQLFCLQGPGSRSLDRVESILSRDKKDATYKPALLRALADLALTQYHQAVWRNDGRVALPIDLVAEKWLEYFWPLFESEKFIPQKRGEKPGCQKPVAFRSDLEKLIGTYRRSGGLKAFTIQRRSDSLPVEVGRQARGVLSKLRNTIRSGPVYYSGGGGSGVFQYDPKDGRILMDADLWRELSTMGSWIVDATILRWAELTSEISGKSIQPSEVIDPLLVSPIGEREVGEARKVYDALEQKECVWTGQSIRSRFDVDHAIPFALWRNNDLWNLLPASPRVNNQKRDRLPARPLLLERKDCIIYYWKEMRSGHPNRFDFESGRLLGEPFPKSNWENRLFDSVVEAVEFTLSQQGIDGWVPGRERKAARHHQPRAKAALDAAREAGRPVRLAIVEDPPAEERFVSLVPFFDLEAAAGAFGPEQGVVDETEVHRWIRVPEQQAGRDVFAMRVVGRSMEPRIPDGSICLFRRGDALVGSRAGRIVLVQLKDSVDPETGGRLTVKRYTSEKIREGEDGWRHDRITLHPLNPGFSPIVIESAEEGALSILGEFVSVIE